jgi:hypothetical protein
VRAAIAPYSTSGFEQCENSSMMLDGPQAVEAGLLAEHRLLEHLVVGVALAALGPGPGDGIS